MKKLAAFLLLASLAACGKGNAVTAPSAAALPEWSPYLGVHWFDWDKNTQQPYLQPLLDKGAVRGIRIDYNGPDTQLVASWALANGADDVLGILPNDALRGDPCAALDSAVRSAPAIRFWEIGNEVQLFVSMTPEEYVPIYAAVAACAEKYPDIIVIPAAPVGVMGGVDFLRRALDLGLLELAQKGQARIIALHYYSTGSVYLPEAKRQVQRLPASTEIWVTETGIAIQAAHTDFVETEYPRLRANVRATRIYWYVFAECSEYSLVWGLPASCTDSVRLSPLYTLLNGGQR